MDGTDSLFYYYPLPKKKPPVSPSPCPTDHHIPTTITNANTDTTTTKTTTATTKNATINNNNNNKNSFPFYKPIEIKERDFLFNYNPFHKHKAAPTSSSLDSPPTNTKTTKKMDSHGYTNYDLTKAWSSRLGTCKLCLQAVERYGFW
jgi:hypothetical protein